MFEKVALNYIWVSIGIFSSIISLIIGILLIYFTTNLKTKLIKLSDIRRFNKERFRYLRDLIAYRDSVAEKDIAFDERLLSDITVIINSINGYKGINSIRDRYKISVILKTLNLPLKKINTQQLCNQLSYFISLCEKEREELL